MKSLKQLMMQEPLSIYSNKTKMSHTDINFTSLQSEREVCTKKKFHLSSHCMNINEI